MEDHPPVHSKQQGQQLAGILPAENMEPVAAGTEAAADHTVWKLAGIPLAENMAPVAAGTESVAGMAGMHRCQDCRCGVPEAGECRQEFLLSTSCCHPGHPTNGCEACLLHKSEFTYFSTTSAVPLQATTLCHSVCS